MNNKDLIEKFKVKESDGNWDCAWYAQIDVYHYKNRGYDVILEQGNDNFGLTYKQVEELRDVFNKILEDKHD